MFQNMMFIKELIPHIFPVSSWKFNRNESKFLRYRNVTGVDFLSKLIKKSQCLLFLGRLRYKDRVLREVNEEPLIQNLKD